LKKENEMQMRPEIQIQSILKAMTDVVMPAVDPKNPLAQEQARLCMGMLSVMASQLPRQYRFDCDELGRLLALSARMQELPAAMKLAPKALATLNQGSKIGRDVQTRARAEPSELLDAVRGLRAATAHFVQEAFETDTSGLETVDIQQLVLDSSKEQLLRDRAWVLGQGWEAESQALPTIDVLLADAFKVA
jgi:hypothetical protein